MSWTFTPPGGSTITLRNPTDILRIRNRDAPSQPVLGGEPTIFDMSQGPTFVEIQGVLSSGIENVDTKIGEIESLEARTAQPVTVVAHKSRYDGNYVIVDVEHRVSSVLGSGVAVYRIRMQKVL